MKNYIEEARNVGIFSARINDDYDLIKNYKINREAKYVEITYMNDKTYLQSLDETSISELNQLQEQQLQQYKDAIIPQINSELKLSGTLAGTYGLCMFLQYSLQNWLFGSLWLSVFGLYVLKLRGPYKLKKEMNLVSWIIDNKELVDKVIEDEVKEHLGPIEEDFSTLNPIKKHTYLNAELPYSKDLYENGINLSNIDELNTKQMQKIKKKAKKLGGNNRA